MVNCDGWTDCKRKGALQAKTGIGGLTLSDDPFMKDNDHCFSDDMTLWPRIEYGHILAISSIARELILKSSCYLGSNLKPTTTLNRAS